MAPNPWSRSFLFPFALGLSLSVWVTPADAASSISTSDAYLRAVAQHFQLPLDEVRVLADWNLPLEEVPVVLYVAQRTGVSPDALIAIRRAGTSWMDVARRYGLDAGIFHTPMESGEAGELLGDARARFQGVPQSQWSQIQLSDREVIALVNVRFLSRELGTGVGQVVEARSRSRDFVEAYQALLPRR